MQKLKAIKVAGVLILIIYSCGSLINKPKDDIKAIRITQIFPFLNSNGKIVGFDTANTNIYYYGDQILFSDFYEWKTLKDGEVVNTEMRQNFFVYTKGNKYGLFYDKYKSQSDKQLLVDSMLSLQWYSNFKLNNISLKQIYRTYAPNPEVLQIHYSTKGTIDTGMIGVSFLKYNKELEGIDFSLARELDTVPNMRLFEMRSINYGRYFKAYDFTLDTLEQIHRMQKIPIKNKEEILYYFNQDKKITPKN